VGRDWRFCVTGANDFDVEATLPGFAAAKIGWVLNSPGYIEVDLLPSQVSDAVTPGNHRIMACEGGSGYDFMWQTCYLTHLSQFGPPGDVRFRAAGVGLESIFDWRIIHNEWAARASAVEHLEFMMEDLQVLQGGGDMGFDNDVSGTFIGGQGPLLSTCLGVVAGDFIRELAGRTEAGFDWEVNIYNLPPQLTIYKPDRSYDAEVSISEENCQEWSVELDTSDLLTTVTALGEKSDPWGPRHNLARTSLGDVYGRREVVIDTDHGGDGDADEIREQLLDAASEELSRRAGARLQVRAKFIEGRPMAPWTLNGAVWLGANVTLDLPSYLGGTQVGRCTEISVSIVPAGMNGPGTPGIEVLEYVFDTLVGDITEGEDSS
jgi:hypothetical protein